MEIKLYNSEIRGVLFSKCWPLVTEWIALRGRILLRGILLASRPPQQLSWLSYFVVLFSPSRRLTVEYR